MSTPTNDKPSTPSTGAKASKTVGELLEILTEAELREIILALCIPGRTQEGLSNKVKEVVQQAEVNPEQLKWVLPRILVGSNLALCRAESVTAKILSKRKPETKS
ncbi:hypothetical protein MGN70_010947 [Eutypa lata]|nr:hypothetical protein MGN70_010947 [Eutypa lata]